MWRRNILLPIISLPDISNWTCICLKTSAIRENTGSGKSTIVQVTGTLLRGVTFIVVPLLALGSDQDLKGNKAMESSQHATFCINLDVVDEDNFDFAILLGKIEESNRLFFLYT